MTSRRSQMTLWARFTSRCVDSKGRFEKFMLGMPVDATKENDVG